MVSTIDRHPESTPAPVLDWRQLAEVSAPSDLAALSPADLREADRSWRVMSPDERADAIRDARMWRDGSLAEAVRHGFATVEAYDADRAAIFGTPAPAGRMWLEPAGGPGRGDPSAGRHRIVAYIRPGRIHV